jgi:hypothetical protein
MSEKKIWVLLVEDNKLVRKLRSMQLYKAGFQMLSAEDGVKGLGNAGILYSGLHPAGHSDAQNARIRISGKAAKKRETPSGHCCKRHRKESQARGNHGKAGNSRLDFQTDVRQEIAKLIHKAVSTSDP